MQLDAYQNETAQIARYQAEVLGEAAAIIRQGKPLSRLEENGVLHALQVLVENAIGKSKHIIKAAGHEPPLSGYDAFMLLARTGAIPPSQLPEWNNAIGLRNRIVHDYMNIRMDLVLNLVKSSQYQFIVDFLLSPMPAVEGK